MKMEKLNHPTIRTIGSSTFSLAKSLSKHSLKNFQNERLAKKNSIFFDFPFFHNNDVQLGKQTHDLTVIQINYMYKGVFISLGNQERPKH